MRIAFDVKGTIDGPRGRTILLLLRKLKARGHEIVVWSNLYTYAVEAVEEHGLDVPAISKASKSDFDDRYDMPYFDLAVEDDTNQTYLAANNFLWVHDVNESTNLDELILKIEEQNNNKP